MITQTITIEEYLAQKGITFKETEGELITNCVFNNCDEKSPHAGHLYFNKNNATYYCHKCGEKGNIFTLAKHLGDDAKDVMIDASYATPINKVRKKAPPIKVTKNQVEEYHNALPTRIRKYLNDRCITDRIIDEYKLGWGQFYGKLWIVIPVTDINGDIAFLKLRRDPEDTGNQHKNMCYSKDSRATIYGWEMVKNNKDFVFVCEGELDQLVAISNGLPAVTSTGGAKTFKQEWVKYFEQLKSVYICFDIDEAGKDGALRVAKMLCEVEDLAVYNVTLPEELGDGGDLTDYFTQTDGNIDDLVGKYAKEVVPFETIRVHKIEHVKNPITFDEWRNTIEDNFPDLVFPAEIALSIIAQILIKDVTNPFALVLVDVPASGKTIAINFFADIEGLTYASDKFTPASFVSNAVNVKKEDLKKIDLLPRLRYKMFLIRDLATIFSKREEDLKESLGILTRVLDGEGLNTDTGVHGQRQYVGEYLFMILAASTPIPPRIWNIMGTLGSRLFFLNMHTKDKSEDQLVTQLMDASYKEKEKQCRKETKNYLYTLWNKHQDGVVWNKQNENKEYLHIVSRTAKLLARLRGVIQVWKDKTPDEEIYDHTEPIIEQPQRINQLFYNLCRGHALVCERTTINTDDLRLIIEVAIDSAHITRSRLFRALLDHNGVMKTSQVESTLKYSKTTALKEMEKLKILEVCTIKDIDVIGDEKELHLSEDFKWFLSDECKKIRGIPLSPKQTTLSDTL